MAVTPFNKVAPLNGRSKCTTKAVVLPEQFPSSPLQRSSRVSPEASLTLHFLRLLSTQSGSEVSLADLLESLPPGDVGRQSQMSLGLLSESALHEAMLLWRAVLHTNSKTVANDVLAYVKRWFQWSELAGLGRFCPITKILFDARLHTRSTLRMLRRMQDEWQGRLEEQIHQDRSVALTDDAIQEAVNAIIGFYFARQLAMQADEEQGSRLQPWLDMVEKSLRPK